MPEPLLEPILRHWRYYKVKKYISPESVVCDIGCGAQGEFLSRNSRLIKQGIGFDKKINKSSISNIKFVKTELEDKLPLENQSVNLVTMLAAIEHLESPQQMLKECYRILQPNGLLLITTPHPWGEPVLGFLNKLKLVSTEEIEDHKNYFNQNELKKILISSGFSLSNIKTRYFEFGFNMLVIAKK